MNELPLLRRDADRNAQPISPAPRWLERSGRPRFHRCARWSRQNGDEHDVENPTPLRTGLDGDLRDRR